MKKIMLMLIVLVLFLVAPLQSYARFEIPSLFPPQTDVIEDAIENSHTLDIEGETYIFTLLSNNDTQTVEIEHEDGTIQTVSYNQSKDEMRFNDELVQKELFVEIKQAATGFVERDVVINPELSAFTEQVEAFSTSSYNWKHVKSYKNSFNVKLFTVLTITGVVLLIPTGIGPAVVVYGAKAISVLVAAIFSSSKQSSYYYTFDTYYSPLNGYYNNKFVLSVYKDSQRTKLLKSVSHTTRAGKKY